MKSNGGLEPLVELIKDHANHENKELMAAVTGIEKIETGNLTGFTNETMFLRVACTMGIMCQNYFAKYKKILDKHLRINNSVATGNNVHSAHKGSWFTTDLFSKNIGAF